MLLPDNNLLEDIKARLLAQAEAGGHIDTETELAEHFGVTRYRIRKELDLLSQMGLLRRQPKNGIEVLTVTRESLTDQIRSRLAIANYPLDEFVEARIWIETSLIKLIVPRIKASDALKLEGILARMETHAAEPEVADACDREFHMTLMEICGNPLLQIFSGVLLCWFEETAVEVRRMNARFFEETASELRRILTAIRRGDGAEAERLLTRHLTDQTSFFSQKLRQDAAFSALRPLK